MKDHVANILGAALIAAVAGVAFAIESMKEDFRKVRLAAGTLCPVDAPVAAHVALMVDRTDPLTPAQVELLRSTVARLRAELPVRGRLSVHLISSDPATAAETVLDRCNPGDGSTIDPMWGNPRRAQELFDLVFAAPLDALVGELQTPASAQESPLLAAMAVVAVGLDQGTSVRRIVLFSDLLENTTDFSVYRDAPDVSRFMQTSAFGALSDGRLDGVVVELAEVASETSSQRQTPELVSAWLELLRAAGARVETAEAIDERLR